MCRRKSASELARLFRLMSRSRSEFTFSVLDLGTSTSCVPCDVRWTMLRRPAKLSEMNLQVETEGHAISDRKQSASSAVQSSFHSAPPCRQLNSQLRQHTSCMQSALVFHMVRHLIRILDTQKRERRARKCTHLMSDVFVNFFSVSFVALCDVKRFRKSLIAKPARWLTAQASHPPDAPAIDEDSPMVTGASQFELMPYLQ